MKKIVPPLLWSLAFGLIGWVLLRELRDPDLFWHLAAGRAMVHSKTLLKTDIFSYTMAGTPWINFEWLSQILLYGIVRLGGFFGVALWKALFGMLSVGLLTLCLRRQNVRGPWLFSLVMLGFFILWPRLLERPELFSLVLFPLMAWILMKGRGTSSLSRTRFHVLIFLVMAVWVNLHGGFLYGLAFIILLACGARLAREEERAIQFFDRAVVVALIAILFNPYGPKVGWIYLEHMSYLGNLPKGAIQEWGDSTLKNGPYFWGLYGLVLLVLGRSIFNKGRPGFLWLPSIVVFGVWGAVYYRNMALFIFPALSFLADAGPVTLGPLKAKKLTPFLKTVLWGLCFLPFLGHPKAIARSWPEEWIQPRALPFKACSFVNQNGIEGHMYNTYHYGGAIEWALGPDRKVFWDGRYIFHPMIPEILVLNEQLPLGLERSRWPQYLNHFGVDYAITEPSTLNFPSDTPGEVGFTNLNAMFPRTQWALVYWDDAAFVFLKRSPRFDNLIQRLEYRFVWPYSTARMRLMLEQGVIKREDFKNDLLRHDREVGFTYLGQQMEKLLTNLAPS